jgi:DNA-binding Lrp family transcriptional regulator
MKSAALNKLDPADRAILNIIQTRFPLVSRPYAAVAAEVGLTEAEVLTRVTALKEVGIIRRIGGIFASDKLGFSSTLVALKVATEKIEAVALAVSAYPGVTHNYERAHEFNLWFTLVSRTETELEQVLNEIMCLDGVLKLRNLPALKLFKIGVNFDLTEEEPCC